jgi:AbrB family looped-hinge helix DNA binding protein
MAFEASVQITSNGRVTIPKGVRDRFDINRGTTVTFEISDNGTVTLSPRKDSWELLEEIQQTPRRTVKSVEELMDESKQARDS